MSAKKPSRLIFLGPPGAGKGTQSGVLSRTLSIPKLSTGDMLRESISKNGPQSDELKAIMNAGNLVPDSIMIQLIEERTHQPDCKNGFILDGFPRTLSQAIALEAMFVKNNFDLPKVIYLYAENNFLLERLLNRYNCKQCGTSYHVKFHKPKVDGVCDVCGSTEFVQREDDSETSIKKRLDLYFENTLPLVEFYRHKRSIIEILAIGEIEEISNNIISSI